MKIQIINGPNLNLLGKREVDIYGYQNFKDYYEKLLDEYQEINLHFFQSNIEGEIVDKIHETGFTFQGIIINPAAYSHTSVAIADAIASVEVRVIEVHISNIFSRETYRKKTLTAEKCTGFIAGFGLESYRMALEYLIRVEPGI